MKKILLASTATSVVMFSGSVQAQTCTKTPDCATLGYTKTASDCSGLAYTRCPFDDSKYSCEGTPPTCASLGFTDTAKSCYNQYIPCPTDPTNTSAVKCLFTNKAGDLKYSRQTADHDGWMLASGSSFYFSHYPELYSALGTDKLPDYRGYFLKADAKNSQSYMNTPEAAGLPNITGNFSIGLGKGGAYRYPTGIITTTSNYSMSVASGNEDNWGRNLVFDASKGGTDPVYGKSDTVTPPNYTANLFIFAGKCKTPNGTDCLSKYIVNEDYYNARCAYADFGLWKKGQRCSAGYGQDSYMKLDDGFSRCVAYGMMELGQGVETEICDSDDNCLQGYMNTYCYDFPGCVKYSKSIKQYIEEGYESALQFDYSPYCSFYRDYFLLSCELDLGCLAAIGITDLSSI